eukprot:16080-Rhodomonas_salina.1
MRKKAKLTVDNFGSNSRSTTAQPQRASRTWVLETVARTRAPKIGGVGIGTDVGILLRTSIGTDI